MKIYLAASASNIEKQHTKLLILIQTIKSMKHHVVNPYFNAIAKGDVSKVNKSENVYKSLKSSIEGADCVIAEISYQSVSLGIQLEYALNKKIPVLCIYDSKIVHELPLLIRDYKDPLFFKHEYTEETLGTVLVSFFKKLPKSRIKFNLFITTAVGFIYGFAH